MKSAEQQSTINKGSVPSKTIPSHPSIFLAIRIYYRWENSVKSYEIKGYG